MARIGADLEVGGRARLRRGRGQLIAIVWPDRGVRPGMDDEQYVHKLSGFNPALDKNELLDLLKRLKRRNVSESEMVQLAVESAKWIDT